MLRNSTAVIAAALLTATSAALAADGGHSVAIVTSSNAVDNQLLVYDRTGRLLESLPTLGQGGASRNAGGIAAKNDLIAVVNFGSETVSVFERRGLGFELRQVVPSASQPVSVTFGADHLYVLGTTTVESHRLGRDGVEAADGTAALIAADNSAAQIGVVGNQLIVTEKSGTIETITLRDGAVFGTPAALPLPADSRDTPFGLVTRGSNAYVTIAGADRVAVVKNGAVTATAATGTPGGAGEHSPCWAALVGPYLFTTNSPSHSISRLIAGGRNITLDAAVAAPTVGAPIDIAAEGDLLAVVESNDGGPAHLTQFRIDEDGNLTQTVSTEIAPSANGVVILSEN